MSNHIDKLMTSRALSLAAKKHEEIMNVNHFVSSQGYNINGKLNQLWTQEEDHQKKIFAGVPILIIYSFGNLVYLATCFIE